MSLLSSRVGLRHRCSIERDASAGTPNTWGNPSTPDWTTFATDVPCRAWTTAGREPASDEQILAIEDRRVTVPLDTDVTDADRLGDVTDRGAVIFDGPMNIQAVLRYPDHLELMVERIS